MEGTSHAVHQNILNKSTGKYKKHNFVNKAAGIISGSTFVLAVLGFLVGRVSMLDSLSPFSSAFLMAAALVTDIRDVALAGLCILAGILTRSSGYYTVQAVVTIMLIFLAVKVLKLNSRTSMLKSAAASFAINLFVALLFNLIINGQFILYNTLLGLFNSTIVMALVYIFHYSIPVVLERSKRTKLSNEEMICVSILCAIVISGMADIYIYGISLKIVLSVFIITAAAFGQGASAGAAIGTTIGLITCISSSQVPLVLGTYAFCGVLSGIFKDMGKFGAVLGFFVGDLVMLFYLGGNNNIIGFKELAGGLLIFTLFPSSLLQKVIPFLDNSSKITSKQQSYAERIKDMAMTRISGMKGVFKELAKTLEEDESSETLRQNSEVNAMINSIVDKVCSDCDARNICWKKDFYSTYQNIFEIIDVIESDGSIDMETIPQDLNKKCLRINQLMKVSNNMFEIYRMNYKWRRKAQEGKKVICEQLDGINGILDRLSDEIKREVNFKGDIEAELSVALDKEGIDFNDVAVARDNMGKYEVNIYKRACLGKRKCIKDVNPVVSRVLKKKMKRDRTSCNIKDGTNLCCFKLVEAVKYQISTGVTRVSKDNGGMSGDNYSFIELNDGKFMIVLSDGMGTGPAAAAESNAAVTLLEKYLEAGFDKATALRAINSAMALKSPDDSFATVDLCLADLYSGDVEFTKVGAASTYIKRVDGSIETINSTSLPIGILNNVDIETKTINLSHGDMIIMVTDGIQEAGERGDNDWIVRELESIGSRNPQQVSDELVMKAKQRNNGKINDDMTVLVSRIWEAV